MNRTISNYGVVKMEKFYLYVPQFFEFYATLWLDKIVMSVNTGKAIDKRDYEYSDAIKNGGILNMIGPFNKKHNVGKCVPINMDRSFVGTSSGLFFMRGFLKNHRWNVEYNRLLNNKNNKNKTRK